MDISQRRRAVALSFLSPLPELRRWSPRLPPPPPLLCLFAHLVSNCFSLFSSRAGTTLFSFSLRAIILHVSSYSHPISRLADELNRAGGPPYFCLAGRVHSPRHCSDCDRTETSWALLLVERTIYRIGLARETKEELRICNCNVAVGPPFFFDSINTTNIPVILSVISTFYSHLSF